MKKLFPLLLILLIQCLPSMVSAQDLEIKGDTIRVSPSAFPLMSFMGEIRDVQPLCSDYKIATSTTTITIRPGTSKPTKFCRLIVSEGSSKSPRQHQFVLMFDKDADASDNIYDYSTKDLIEKRIEYLDKMKKGADGGGDDDEKLSKKERKKKEKEKAKEESKQEDEKPKVAAKTKGKDKGKDKGKEKTKPAPKKEEVAEEESPEPQKENTKTYTSNKDNTSNRQNSGGDENNSIKDVPPDLLEARVKLKINGFYRACELLCAKTDIPNTIKYGMKLFDNDEEVLVETTNGKTNAKSETKIRSYLTHLSQLNYKRVEMTASNIKFVSKFHLAPDGKWHASAVIIQDFKGFKDNQQVYRDQTNKTIDIIVNTFEEEKDGKTVTKFDIFLGNISVTNVSS